MKKKITAETLYELKFPSEPRFSPDGRYTAFVVKNVNGERTGYSSDIWLSENGSAPRRLTAMGDGGSFCWSPEGKVLFSASRTPEDKKRAGKGEKFTSVYEISPDGGEAVKAFTLEHAAGGLRHVEGSLYLFTARTDEAYPEAGSDGFDKALEQYNSPAYRGIEDTPFWSNGSGFTAGMHSVLYLYDRESGKETQITPDGFDVRSVSAKNGKIVYTGSAQGRVRDMRISGLYLYGIASGSTETLIEPGRLKLGFAELRDCGDVLLTCTDGAKYGDTESGTLHTLDIATKELRPLGDGAVVPVGAVGSDARLGGGMKTKMVGDELYFVSLDRYKNSLKKVTSDGGIETVLSERCGIDSFDVCDGGSIAAIELSPVRTPELYIDSRRITDFSAPLDEYETVAPEYIPFTNADGLLIDGWMLHPAGFEAGKKYPALLEIHGGPRTAFGEAFFHEMQVFANTGYFVLFCNPRGSDGRGDAFADIWGRYGTIDYEDIMAFVDSALACEKSIDPARLGVLGGSYGGYMTNWIIGHTDRFAAAASQRSIANWTSFEFTSDIGFNFTRMNHRTSTHENWDYLWDISPLKYADKVKTPTLFIHSDNDFRCWMVEGIQMFTALRFHGVESRLCLFEGENHELSRSGKPNNRVSRIEEMREWFEKYLHPEEAQEK